MKTRKNYKKYADKSFTIKVVLVAAMLIIIGVIIAAFVAAVSPIQVVQIDGPFVRFESFFREEVVFSPVDWYEYQVKTGDSWWNISEDILGDTEYDIRNLMSYIMQYNDTHNSVLYAGQVVLLPR